MKEATQLNDKCSARSRRGWSGIPDECIMVDHDTRISLGTRILFALHPIKGSDLQLITLSPSDQGEKLLQRLRQYSHAFVFANTL